MQRGGDRVRPRRAGTRPSRTCPTRRRALTGTTLANVNLRWAALRSGRGDDGRGAPAARGARERLLVALARAAVPRPVCGALRAELERREGDLDAARAASTRRSTGSSSAARTASGSPRSPCVGVSGRGRRRGARPRPRRHRGRAQLARLRAGHAGRARAGRRRGHRPRRRRGPAANAARRVRPAPRASPDPAAWAAAAEAWTALERPYPVRAWPAGARPRRTCAAATARRPSPRPARRPRSAGALGSPLAAATRSRAWPRARGCGSTRPPMPASRRRAAGRGPPSASRRASGRCSRCSPSGATNREIGAAALHGREDRQRPRVADPRQARRPQPHRGGRGRAPARPGAAILRES